MAEIIPILLVCGWRVVKEFVS